MGAVKKCPECKSQVAAALRNCPNCPYSFPESADESSADVYTGQSWSPLPMIIMIGLAAVFGGLWKVFLQVGTDPGSIMSETSMIETKPDKAVKKRAQAAFAPEGHWLLRGLVRDLVTLAPVPAARLSFRNAAAVVEAVPDDLGLYSAVLPASGGPYRVVITAKGYSSSYLNPNLEAVPELEAGKRAELARELREGPLPPYEVQGYDTSPVAVDFFLAPAK